MLLKFINRKFEINALKQAYYSKKSEFFVIYGRRRVGKTELIKKFTKKMPHFYFLAKKQNLNIELKEFQKKISEKFNIHLGENNNFEDLFRNILTKTNLKKKFIIIIDEFPYWIAKDEKILSEFQYIWDELLQRENIFLILCGSYMSIMEEMVLSINSPLYGRRTGQLKIEPMKIKYLQKFLPRYKIEDLIKVYGCVGTIPFYLKELNDSMDFFGNIKNTFLNKANILNQEANFLLKEELREINVYFNIIKAIIGGATRSSEIAAKSMVDITNINKYLSVLVGLKLIKKLKPITAPPKEKRYHYRLKDNYFRFWLTYVYPYQTEIEENADSLLKIIKKDNPSYMGHIFEDFCKKIIRSLDIGMDKIGMGVGTWWHKDEEIDLIALNGQSKEILFAECKWKKDVNAKRLVQELDKKSKFVKWHNAKRIEYFAIFAKSFSKKIRVHKGKKVYCFDLGSLEKKL
ncbi:MAG: ATP-binding protein [Nanoarchaeota archaeon]|nr:ATP-binding protein [Nanoarchaeota archaeon]